MRILLDTQVWLWFLVSPDRISDVASDVLGDVANTLFLSAASSLEIAIKYRLGKLPLPQPPSEFIPQRLARDGIESMPVEHHHACAVADLPDHHRDPFDRILICTAQIEDMSIVTSDAAFLDYDVRVIPA